MSTLKRRDFLAAGALTTLAASAGASPTTRPHKREPGDDHRGPAVIASGNGLAAVQRAFELIKQDRDTAEAIVDGVRLIEDDPNDMSVGLGGLPNEDGVVQLDASVLHGPTHKAGAVACIENIKNPAAVALEVLRRTDHAMIVGEGAKRFALRMGFKEENLLTNRAREAWLRWKRNSTKRDDWLNDDELDWNFNDQGHGTASLPLPSRGEGGRATARSGEGRQPADTDAYDFTTGTVHCSAVNANNDLSACTTTSGLSWKIPGRVGDSPIIGAGMYCDNDTGAAGATGRGEAAIHSCTAYQVVDHMARGLPPTEACLEALRSVARRTKQKRLLNDKGQPNFGLSLYALRKDGAFGGACMSPGGSFAIATETIAEVRRCTPLFG
ncbi:MAG: N(4)-(beta-N-acetylglucosaminyl)-L-asparaginase [Planctomycetota bacterium]